MKNTKGKTNDRRVSGPEASRSMTATLCSEPPTVIRSRRMIVFLTVLSYLLMLPLFEPHAFWPFGWIAFVPWLLAVRLSEKAGWIYLFSFLLGMVYWMTHCRWLLAVSPVVYLLTALILGLYWPLIAALARHACRRRYFDMALAFPPLWVAQELLHSRGSIAAPWCLLGHSQVHFSSLVQVADTVGVFGVSFVVAMINGCIADLCQHFLERRRAGQSWSWPRRLVTTSAITLAVLVATLIYGRIRLAEKPAIIGPRVAVLQGDFPLKPGMDVDARLLKEPPPANDELDMYIRARKESFNADKRIIYRRLLDQAVEDRPDLFVLPESPWNMTLNREYRESPLTVDQEEVRLQHAEFVRLAQQYGASIVVGGLSKVVQAPGAYPALHEYNSAFVYSPGKPEPSRYDKVNLVFFGEYLPFRESWRFHWLYRLLNDGFWNPWGCGGKEYVSTPGNDYTTFECRRRSDGRGEFTFAVAICYEDLLGHAYRHFVVDESGRKRTDFMVTISNVGWFGHGNQQAQHLAASIFRAIENRVWIARSVNTGISGFVDSDGRWHDLVATPADKLRPGGIGSRTAEAIIDPRITVYSRYGDWWAWLCVLVVCFLVIDKAILSRFSGRP